MPSPYLVNLPISVSNNGSLSSVTFGLCIRGCCFLKYYEYCAHEFALVANDLVDL